ncbi:MAG: LolA family protein [Spirochaetaceae bacterium]
MMLLHNRLRNCFAAVCVLFCITITSASAQQIETASQFLQRLSEEYAGFEDYMADIVFTTENERMEGTLYHRRPDLLNIEFTRPDEQFIITDGEYLRVHVPSLNTTLTQRLRTSADAPGGIATAEGLALLQRNFSVAFQSSPDFVGVNSTGNFIEPVGPDTEVINLRFDTSTPEEGYRQLIVSVNADYRIRRIVGTTVDLDRVQFDFTNVRVNRGLPDSRFEYVAPPASSTFEDFLFDSSN